MTSLSDLELRKTDESPEPEPVGRSGVWVAVAVALFVVAAATAVYVVYGRRPAAPPAAETKPVERPAADIALGKDPDRIAVPPLGESDPIVRELVRQITSHPSAMAWLATNGLIRNFTVVVTNIVDGARPAKQLGVLKPKGEFQVVERNGNLFIDSRSYERYDRTAAAAASIDPAGASRVYATLKPRIEEAYSELGEPGSFDRALERAIVQLLQTPVVDGPIRVEPKGIGYGFVDPKLEGLTHAQKQLLRTGPQNVKTIQSALRAIGTALGIPAERLK